ncbi:hypothetical protein [Armatimonas sp.]|uniref:hypothetical protein n=1 Tax=Armatimonas sp. TaxID=1872638 RepID=UPI0037514412
MKYATLSVANFLVATQLVAPVLGAVVVAASMAAAVVALRSMREVVVVARRFLPTSRLQEQVKPVSTAAMLVWPPAVQLT